jgi:hypothetical protein
VKESRLVRRTDATSALGENCDTDPNGTGGKRFGKLIPPLYHDRSIAERIVVANREQLLRTLEAIEIEVMQGQATAPIFVHKSEAGTGRLIATSKRGCHPLAKLGFACPERPFETDDRAPSEQDGNFAAQRNHVFRRLAQDSFLREELLEPRISICHQTANLVP